MIIYLGTSYHTKLKIVLTAAVMQPLRTDTTDSTRFQALILIFTYTFWPVICDAKI